MKISNYDIRRAHRYLGVFMGLQFLLWTIGGLYFSWTNIKEIRGENILKKDQFIDLTSDILSLTSVLKNNQVSTNIVYKSIEIVKLLDSIYYKLTILENEKQVVKMYNAQSGNPMMGISIDEAKIIVINQLKPTAQIIDAKYISTTDGHHEYREKPLPAYGVKIAKPFEATIYVDAQSGKIQNVRNDKWRIFDWLWMMHVMDYKNRDDINNWILRIFSALGIITLLSGYALFFSTIKK